VFSSHASLARRFGATLVASGSARHDRPARRGHVEMDGSVMLERCAWSRARPGERGDGGRWSAQVVVIASFPLRGAASTATLRSAACRPRR
jgi:hypothetical protein